MVDSLDKDIFEPSNVNDLSNFQLYCLTLQQYLPQDIANTIDIEFNNRNVSSQEFNGLETQYKKVNGQFNTNDISTYRKLFILFIPFPIIIHAIIASRYHCQNELYKWKQHWKFIGFGFSFWLLAIVLSLVL